MLKKPSARVNKRPLVRADVVDSALETSLFAASADGDEDKLRDVLALIERKRESVTPEAIEEVVACAFARAARGNHVAVLAFLLALDTSYPTLAFVSLALRYGVCRTERYFPPLPNGARCCAALRYIGYAAVVCVEQNARSALQHLLDNALLEDVEVERCYALAKQRAARFDAPDVGAYRPLLLLLITRFPALLSHNGASSAPDNNSREAAEHMRALESSLVYEYKLSYASAWQ